MKISNSALLFLVVVLSLSILSCGQKATKSATDKATTSNTTSPVKQKPAVDEKGNTVPIQQPETKTPKKKKDNQSTFTIAFGSCNKHDEAQPLWEPILSNQPDLWIWTGDIIYGDTEKMDLLRSKYASQKSNKAYKKLLDYCPVIGTWDDHDFGKNDGGKTYPKKEESKKELLSFLDVPTEAAVRKRKGVYSSHTYGTGDRMIKVILLDCRTFKDDIARKNKVSVPDSKAELIGEAQWKWLEGELKNSKAAINIIVSSIQIIPEEHRFEKWANHPTERNRFMKLINSEQPRNTIVISGDRHIAEISKIKLPDYGSLVEITSSGLTHAYSSFTSEANKHRVGNVSSVLNFGLLKVDWNSYSPVVTMEIRGEDNKQLNMYRVAIKK